MFPADIGMLVLIDELVSYNLLPDQFKLSNSFKFKRMGRLNRVRGTTLTKCAKNSARGDFN